LVIGDILIYFPEQVAKELSFLYQSEQESRALETSVCLRGFKEGKVYSINEVFYPLITYQSYTQVSFKACPDDTLIMLHTHPYKHCEASGTDIRTLNKIKSSNEHVLMIIMCEDNRYAIYS
jgi:proteasome lid subunit RPN8/RPN11